MADATTKDGQRPAATQDATNPDSRRWHYYFEKYEVRDGDSEYWCMAVHAYLDPFSEERWLREMAEFSWSTGNGKPWSKSRLREFLKDPDNLEVYGGMRIYHNFDWREITESEYEVLRRFI
ncbi:MAG: hypothetical protein IT428_12235 [Planctomycetaceae bacterium]|nr:hypothetical protein [Planctomycetaceae bacterium]